MLYRIFVFVVLGSQLVLGASKPLWFSECEGFGCEVTKTYKHTPCQASDESSLSKCLEKEWVHVTFTKSTTISLSKPLSARRGIILDGSSKKVTITRNGIHLQSDSVVYRLRFRGGNDDALQLKGKYRNAWIHKCSLEDYKDGLLDITREFTMVTVSYCEFQDHSKTMLISAGPDSVSDVNIKVTLHHNYFHDVVQRVPRVRFAYVHIYNNVYENWLSYAIGASHLSRVLVENNWFKSSKNANQMMVTKVGDDPKKGYINSRSNYFGPGSKNVERDPKKVSEPPYKYRAEVANSVLYEKVKNEAGFRS